MKEALYDELSLAIAPVLSPPYTPQDAKRLLSWIKTLTFIQKKQLVTICRSASVPLQGTTLYSKTLDILASIPKNLRDLINSLVTDHTTCGLLLSLCMAAPIPDQEVRVQYSTLLAKEMSIMESSPLPGQLQYNCFFGDYLSPLHNDIPPNPRMAMYIHSIIDSWILEQETIIHYPHMTSKLVAQGTQNLISKVYPDYLSFEEEGCSQHDLEYIYHKFSDKLEDGECEIKQRWYPGFLTPRTYYAAGSKAYHSSKYVRSALNSLCDFLPPTERYSRVNPNRIKVKDDSSHILLYDLTSFTSNMHEQRHFLYRLGLYCHGHEVRIVDTVDGLVTVDLGDLILSYNEMNEQPSYSSDRLTGGLVLRHHVAGFLGVFGNLASCTFLHGAVILQTVCDVSELGVAGDDGAVGSKDDQKTIDAIRTLGLMEPSKVYTTNDPGNQVYLKRPCKQLGKRLYADSFALYSMFEHLGDQDDSRFFLKRRSRMERLSAFASSVVAYLRSLQRLILSNEEKERIYAFLCGLYDQVGFPTSGYLPQISSSERNLPMTLIPTLDWRFICENPIEMTIKSNWQGFALITETTSELIKYDKEDLFAGSNFRATMSQELLLLSRLGYVDVVKKDVFVFGEVGLEAVLKHMTTQSSRTLYDVSVLMEIPPHLII